MKNMTSMKTILGAAFLVGALTACGDDSADGAGGGGGAAATTAATTSAQSTSSTTSGPTTVASTGTGGEGPTTGSGGAGGEGGEGGGAPVFVFADDDYEAYVRVDRHGAVEAGTAGIEAPEGLGDDTTTIRDDYNASNPAEDADGDWLAEITTSVDFFHDNLDGDLISLGFTPATVNEALGQAGPVIIPDTIKYDPEEPTAYPNGRALTDPVVDITLAAVLLDLGTHDLDTFVGVLNPETNDVDFEDAFPFLAAPHPEPEGTGGGGGGG